MIFLHGNPTWSFMYRRMIHRFSAQFRCIAPDYPGFGLSEKPVDRNYKPHAHAEAIRQFIESLGVNRMFLVVHDWGGPIGLSYALRKIEKIAGLIILNSWCWPVSNIPRFALLSRIFQGFHGDFLTRRCNLFLNLFFRLGFADFTRVKGKIQSQYRGPFVQSETRRPTGIFPAELLGSEQWLKNLWKKRNILAKLPVFIAWGMQDRAFRMAQCRRWERLFRDKAVEYLPGCGHFVPEEIEENSIDHMIQFVEANF